MKTQSLPLLYLIWPVFTCQIVLLLTPQAGKSASFSLPWPSSDTIELYLFHQICAGETFQGLTWQQDTVATFFQPGLNGPDTLRTVEIDVIPTPAFALTGDSLLCAGDSGTLTVVGFFSTYQWSTGTTIQSIAVGLPGNYSVTVTASNGCTGARTTAVVVSMPDFITDADHPGCAGAADGMIAISGFFGGQAPYEVSINGSPFRTDSIFAGLSAGDYLLMLRDAAGCADSLLLTLTEPPPFTVDIGPDLLLVPDDTVRLSAAATGPVSTWDWQPAGLFDCADCPMPLVVRPASTNVSVTIINAAGCTASDALVLHYDGELRLFVPNIFSPNGDGTNDFLNIFPGKGNWEIVEFLVFDRWGSVVFHSESPFQYPQTLEWDGRSLGKLLLPGVYGWSARLRFADGSERVRAGDVTIFR